MGVSGLAGLIVVVVSAGGLRAPQGLDSPGLGGAGAFIPPSHANGVFDAGGPLAGVGGAGAFIPMIIPRG